MANRVVSVCKTLEEERILLNVYYFYGIIRADIWASLVIGHIAVIFAMYYTFKQFHNISNNKYRFGTYHSYGRGRDYVIYRDKFGNPFKVRLPKNDPGGEHE